MLRSLQLIHRPTGSRLVRAAGYTLAELSVAFGVAMLMMAGFMGFMVTSARMSQGIAKQSVMNQQAGNGLELMIQRIRLANTMSVDAQGETLTLGFDDDPTVDNDFDGLVYDDTDHTEMFSFGYPSGAKKPLQGINFICWISSIGPTTRQMYASVRKLPNLDVFTLTNGDATVLINFGLIDTYGNDATQNIEIRTAVTRRNHR
jgi:hypothetical protein